MRVTVCELREASDAFDEDWRRLCAHVSDAQSDLVLLPEMPFDRWFATEPTASPARWSQAVEAHVKGRSRFSDLSPAIVLSTQPVERDGRRLNEAFVWKAGQAHVAHQKRYLPDEDGFWEASWYEAGDGVFDLAEAGPARVGFQICTELWFFDAARAYGLAGAHIIATPRATPSSSSERWLVAGRAAAMAAGAFALSSNRAGPSETGSLFGGRGWIIDPDGDVLAETSPQRPFATCSIDLSAAEAAKATYPRYVR